MAKLRLSPAFLELRGRLGKNLVVKIINGQPYLTVKASPKKKHQRFLSGTEKQNKWRTHFHHATQFAKAVKESPTLLAHYQALAKKHGKRLRDICLSDYFTVPTIKDVDVSGYQGQTGDKVRFQVLEKYPLSEVKVSLSGQNKAHETGPAKARGKTWTYTATTTMPPGKVNLHIYARDYASQSAAHRADWLAGVWTVRDAEGKPIISPQPMAKAERHGPSGAVA